MTITSATSTAHTAAASAPRKSSLADLGSADFIKLMTAQMQQQDPTAPVDQKEMIAQMAQFSSLSATTGMADTLKSISAKLDTLISVQTTPSATAKA